MNEEKPFNPYDASRPIDEQAAIQPVVPDFVTKTKEYIKQHPGKLREIAPDMFQQLNEAIDTAEIDLPVLGKVRIGEQFRKYQGDIFEKYPIARIFLDPDLQDVQEGVKDAPGQTFIPPDRQREEEEQPIEPEEIMTTQDAKDLLDFIAELSEQGFSLPEIADAVWRDYRIEYHPLKIKRMLKSYYGRPEPEEGNGNRDGSQSLKIYQKLLSRNSELQQKVAELSAKLPPELAKVDRKGIIRRFLSWLW